MSIRDNYAQMTLECGVNLQRGQILVIDAPVETADFIHTLTLRAFRMGAKDVVVHYDDPVTERIRLRYADAETLTDIPAWMTESQLHYSEKDACFLRLSSPVPNGKDDAVDPARLSMRQKAINTPLQAFRLRRMSNLVSWSAVPVPNPAWAKQVFPALSEQEAMEKLWTLCYQCCYVTKESGTAGWNAHVDAMQTDVRKLNAMQVRHMHFENGVGTDLHVDVCEGGVFAGGICHCPEPDGIVFAPNIPTEEILATPHRFSANGTVHSTFPLVYNGHVIDPFTLTFENGKVVAFRCDGAGEDILAGIIKTDEGSARLGEVAIVPYSSPINRTGVLFYNTLLDENASCHLALGMGYTDVMPGGDRSTEALVARGLNTSALHVDFMFGSADMRCTATLADGSERIIFDKGEFVL